MNNRSLPTSTVLPHVEYPSVPAALAWLTRVFGFAEHYRYGVESPESFSGCQVWAGRACLMLSPARGNPSPRQAGFGTQYLTIFVDDVQAHYQRAQAEGAVIFEELNETVYGERQYVALDLDGHRWLFSQHVRDLAPQDWGATPAAPHEVP